MPNLFEHLHELIANKVDPLEHESDIWDRYGQTVAVMVLDSSGFSRVSEKHGILHFLSRLMIMREIVQPVMEDHGLLESRFEADNLFAVFKHPDDAIKAALKAHEVVHQSNLMLTESEPFRVCIGIGFGPMLYSETMEGYFGEEMNQASKLGEDTAEGGDTLLTASACEHASTELVSLFSKENLTISGIEVTYFRHHYQD